MAAFVTADWVAARLEEPQFLVIDTRSAMRYLMGHLKSVVSLPQAKILDSQLRLLPLDQLGALFGSVGLGDRETPVLCDGYDGRNAAMVAWAMEYLGRDDVHVMDVVFDQWKGQGREVFYRPVPTEVRNFTPRVNPSVRASLAEVSGASDLRLVDTRSREEYRGETETDERPGHIPGAVNIVWQKLVGQDGQLTCSDEITRQVLTEAGIGENEPIVAYCQVGARAAVAYQAFRRLGYDVRLYDGSYAEWERSGQPVEQ
jgi:thiosulfate/3-mercaptopyruvate sulfurtransferase